MYGCGRKERVVEATAFSIGQGISWMKVLFYCCMTFFYSQLLFSLNFVCLFSIPFSFLLELVVSANVSVLNPSQWTAAKCVGS